LIPSGKPPGGVYRSQSKLDAPRSALSRILLQQGCLWTNPCVIARADFVQDPLGYGRFIQPVTRVFIQRQLVAQRYLPLVAQALDSFGLLLRPRQRGTQQPGEDRNDRDDHEQFDQREARGVVHTAIGEISTAPSAGRLGTVPAMNREKAKGSHKRASQSGSCIQ